mmetsp:Transcript_25891/g.72226  ORF Transcript_25891/g.72226 Transcript_25891/m.72226 type:complete len:205 (+) Transcript_25891:151-765(+)
MWPGYRRPRGGAGVSGGIGVAGATCARKEPKADRAVALNTDAPPEDALLHLLLAATLSPPAREHVTTLASSPKPPGGRKDGVDVLARNGTRWLAWICIRREGPSAPKAVESKTRTVTRPLASIAELITSARAPFNSGLCRVPKMVTGSPGNGNLYMLETAATRFGFSGEASPPTWAKAHESSSRSTMPLQISHSLTVPNPPRSL